MGDVIRAVLAEIVAEPARFVAEAVQSLVLIGLIVFFGRPPLRRRLAARQARIAAALDEADAADREAVRLREEAAALTAARPAEVPAMAPNAERAALDEGIEAEAGQVVAQARETVEREKEAIRRAAADRLVRLTTEVARRYLDEIVSDEERRAATRRAILESLAEVERSDAAP